MHTYFLAGAMFSLCTYLPAIYVSLGPFDNYSIYLFVYHLFTTHDFIHDYIMSVNYAIKPCTLYEQINQRLLSYSFVYSNVRCK